MLVLFQKAWGFFNHLASEVPYLGVSCTQGESTLCGYWPDPCAPIDEQTVFVCRSEELSKLRKAAAAQLETLYNKVDKRQTAGQ